MESTKVKGFFGLLVCLNGITIGVQADHYSDHVAWDVCEYVFIIFFTFELGLKIIAYKVFCIHSIPSPNPNSD